MFFILGIFLIITIVGIITIGLQAKFEKKRQDLNFFISNIDKIKERVDEFQNKKSGYFNHYKSELWTEKSKPLYNKIKNKSFNNIGLLDTNVNLIKTFISFYKNSEKYRDKFNRKFVQNELKEYDALFSNIENRSLDKQQREAIVKDEDNNLVIAGAGSGKTTTIVGKINYIIEKYKVDPKHILSTSFTKKSAEDLEKRINYKGIKARTLHSLGLSIIEEVELKRTSVYDEEQLEGLVTNKFYKLLKEEEYLNKVTTYFREHLKQSKPKEDFDNQGDYFQYMENNNFRSYNNISKEKKTYKREIVKSIEECKIANFLLFNNIPYEYEAPYKFDTTTKDKRQYKPDFKITANSKVIYLEHFGINNKEQVPKWFAKKDKGETWEDAIKRYKEGMDWKRKLHKKNSTDLIESYSYEFSEGTLFENLEENLNKHNISLKPKSSKEIWDIISKAAEEEVKSIITLFKRFIELMKSKNFDIATFRKKNKLISDKYQRDRTEKFIDIIEPIYNEYTSVLKSKNELDFSDMINTATQYVKEGKYPIKYKYIIIDEFQDSSPALYKLVKALKNDNRECKLFAVGDDWQSIYRFGGSDISFFSNFNSYFGYSITSKIEKTYRFNEPLLTLSSDFIMKNPNQVTKKLIGKPKVKSTKLKIFYYVPEFIPPEMYPGYKNPLKRAFDYIIDEYGDVKNKSIKILGRYNRDLNNIEKTYEKFEINKSKISYKFEKDDGTTLKLEADFLTIHKAKGLEADIIIIVNCNSGMLGFPSQRPDDSVLDLLLSKPELFEYAEERRLFYVAMTRAKEGVCFISNIYKPSKFILEIEPNSKIKKDPQESLNRNTCPKCTTSYLILRKGPNGRFYGCTNFCKYGCDYTERSPNSKIEQEGLKKCPRCTTGGLVLKKGDHRSFYGCTNYREYGCDYTERLPNSKIEQEGLKKCPKCPTGGLVLRKGDHRSFYGCTNYREYGCNYTEQLPITQI